MTLSMNRNRNYCTVTVNEVCSFNDSSMATAYIPTVCLPTCESLLDCIRVEEYSRPTSPILLATNPLYLLSPRTCETSMVHDYDAGALESD